MKNILIVGEPGRGKSDLAEDILSKFQIDKWGPRVNNIFDINKEHKKFKNEIDRHFKYGYGINEYLDFVTATDERGESKVKHSNNLFEEATFFMSTAGNTNQRVINLMCRTFHTKNLNIFLFHLLRKVPTDIYGFADFTFLFRTKDMLSDIESRFKDYPELIEAYKDVQEKTNGTNFDREKKIYLPGSYKDASGKIIQVTAQQSKERYHYKKCLAR